MNQLRHLKHNLYWALNHRYRQRRAVAALEEHRRLTGLQSRCSACQELLVVPQFVKKLTVTQKGFVFSRCRNHQCELHGKLQIAAWIMGVPTHGEGLVILDPQALLRDSLPTVPLYWRPGKPPEHNPPNV